MAAGGVATSALEAGATVNVADLLTPLYVASIIESVFAATAVVVMVKAGETVDPAGTITDAGTVACGSLLLKRIVTPPAGAGPLIRTTLAVVTAPPITVAGDRVSAETAGGVTVRVAVFASPL
jgi:hypothetical protein